MASIHSSEPSRASRFHGWPAKRVAAEFPEFPIAFELGFVEPLVGGGLVRKFLVGGVVVADVGGFVAGDQGFTYTRTPVPPRRNRCGRWQSGAVRHRRRPAGRGRGGFRRRNRCGTCARRCRDPEAERRRVAARIADDDQAAASADQFVEAQVFEVAAIGQIDETGILVGAGEEFPQEAEQSKVGLSRLGLGLPGLGTQRPSRTLKKVMMKAGPARCGSPGWGLRRRRKPRWRFPGKDPGPIRCASRGR